MENSIKSGGLPSRRSAVPGTRTGRKSAKTCCRVLGVSASPKPMMAAKAPQDSGPYRHGSSADFVGRVDGRHDLSRLVRGSGWIWSVPRLGDSYEVREWCSDVTDIMRRIFHRSNLYRAIHMVYEELGAFGTGAMLVLPDYKDVIRCYPLTIGEYAISTNYRGEVDTLFREFGMTVSQLVGEFGIDNVSDTVRQAYHSGNMDQWITVIHAIEPRQGYDKTKSDNLNMPFRSCYMELGAEDGKYLRESGFKAVPGAGSSLGDIRRRHLRQQPRHGGAG